MKLLIIIAFLFNVGSILGWCIEVVFRNFIKPTRVRGVWVNPGFCYGPWLPIYGIGLTVMFLLAYTQSANMVDTSVKSYVILFITISVIMTIIEYLGGLFLLKVLNLRLWDYRGKWGNIQGLICPQFSLIWAILSAVYYFLIHPAVLESLFWLSEHLMFTFFVGLFWGFFIIDLLASNYRASLVKAFGNENNLTVFYEDLKVMIQQKRMAQNERSQIFVHAATDETFRESLERHKEQLMEKASTVKKDLKEKIENRSKDINA